MKTIIGILIFIVWTFISINWYVCGIKELCETKKPIKTAGQTHTFFSRKHALY